MLLFSGLWLVASLWLAVTAVASSSRNQSMPSFGSVVFDAQVCWGRFREVDGRSNESILPAVASGRRLCKGEAAHGVSVALSLAATDNIWYDQIARCSSWGSATPRGPLFLNCDSLPRWMAGVTGIIRQIVVAAIYYIQGSFCCWLIRYPSNRSLLATRRRGFVGLRVVRTDKELFQIHQVHLLMRRAAVEMTSTRQ